MHGKLGLPEHRYDGLLQIPHFYCGVTASNDVIYISLPSLLGTSLVSSLNATSVFSPIRRATEPTQITPV